MTASLARPAISARRYRLVDAATKLGGVALAAGGLEVGGGTPLGFLLGAAGVALGTTTVFIEKHNE